MLNLLWVHYEFSMYSVFIMYSCCLFSHMYLLWNQVVFIYSSCSRCVFMMSSLSFEFLLIMYSFVFVLCNMDSLLFHCVCNMYLFCILCGPIVYALSFLFVFIRYAFCFQFAINMWSCWFHYKFSLYSLFNHGIFKLYSLCIQFELSM